MAVRNVEYVIGLRDKFSSKMGNIQARTQALDRQLIGLRGTIGALFVGFAATRVIGDIIKVGSNFEQLQISFETMLGSGEKAKNLLEEITKFAIKTPFELKDVAKGAKALLAFGIAEEKIIPTLKILGDVSAGLSVPIERLILNFGQVKTQSRLTGRELRDFAIAGVPLLDELAKVMGKSTAEITKLVSAGDVGFEIVEQAFKNMASEGGKFFDLMIKQTASTSGQISNLNDFIGLLQRDLFFKFKPAIDSVVVAIQRWTAFFRDNIDTVVEIIKLTGQFIKILIVYKTLQLAANLIIGGAIIANKLYRLSLLLLNKGLASTIRLVKGFRIALARTGIGLVLLAITELIIQFSGLEDAILKSESAQTKLNNTFSRTITLFQKVESAIGKAFGGFDLSKESIVVLEGSIQKLKQQLRELSVEEIVIFDPEQILTAEEATKERQKRFKEIRRDTLRDISRLEKELTAKQRFGKAAPGITTQQIGITKITSAAPKIFNINIDKLVETINNNVTNLDQGMNKSKDIITEAFLTMLADVQLQVR